MSLSLLGVYGAAVAFAAVWCRLILRLRIRDKKAAAKAAASEA